LEKTAEQVLLGRGRRLGNDPNNVCTYEYMNKEKNNKRNCIFKDLQATKVMAHLEI
jgi:hypothetical protein